MSNSIFPDPVLVLGKITMEFDMTGDFDLLSKFNSPILLEGY